MLPFGAAAFGAQFPSREWYDSLEKPGWAPPAEVFGPVWTLLYALMGVAAWLVWRPRGVSGAPLALGLFIPQLALNGAWTWIFFGLQEPGWAFMELAVLWVFIAATMAAFWRERIIAGVLLVPYFCWVTYAAALNASVWRLH